MLLAMKTYNVTGAFLSVYCNMIHKFFAYMKKSSALSIKMIIIIHNIFFTFEGPLLYRGKYPASVIEQVNYVAHN